ncbi:MAG: GTP pyrophosphokinase [Clostridiaceae bacterium]
MLEKAIEIAARAHKGQADKAGEPYILHPLRVMFAGENELEQICGVLHDVIEDSAVTFDDLRKEGFSERVIAVLDCLTRRDAESYDEFINRILKNETACYVKLKDLKDNLNLGRILNPDSRDFERIEKYMKAEKYILEHLSIQCALNSKRNSF